MAKKVFLTFVLLSIAALSVCSQNLQVHFDPRRTIHGTDDFARNYVTTTFEMFKPDKWGSTFMFVDLDFNMKKGNIGLAYMEIARDQNLGKLPIKAHVEFNGGLGKTLDHYGFSIENAYLLGASYPFAVGSFNFSTYAAYKLYTFDKTSHDVQWTLTWNANFFDNKFTMTGFFDIWSQNKNKGKANWTSGKKVVIITEPQFWYNVNSNLSLGTEVEITSNFYTNATTGKDKAFVNPTIAAKWNF